MKKLSFIIIMFTFFLIVSAIEVGGHLTEDTTWSPAENPYLVTETLYVDAGVTLTILPGTEIKVSGASLSNSYEYTQNFWLNGAGWSLAKYIRVDGRIIAEGTEQDSITFTRMQDDMNFNWGSICITINAELCIFKYCEFEHMGNTGLAISNISEGLDFFNGRGRVQNCKFLNCTVGINSDSYEKELEIINSEFIIDDEVNPYLPNFNPGRNHIMSSQIGSNYTSDVLVCNNIFEGYGSYFGVGVEHLSFAYNKISNCVSSGANGYFFESEFTDCTKAIGGGDSLYIKKNHFIEADVDLDYAYVEISDNYFEDCNIAGPSEIELIGTVKNNIVYNTNTAISGRFEEIYNNIFYNCSMVSSVIGSSNIFYNNLMYNNTELCNLIADTPFIENNIFFSNDIEDVDIFGNPIFRNCIIDFPLEPPLIDGGGNIWVDSLQAQSLFEDLTNGDFHLIEGSLAIDAGFDTLDYYYPFDVDYNHRVWDGDNNGSAIIDIGPYEYGSPAFGGIQGVTYNTINGEPVDYVLLKINDQPGEFTFSDSIGNFEYKLPPSIYDVYVERVFYDDTIEYQVEVIDGEFTQLTIPMYETVDIDNNEIIPMKDNLYLTNFPNPFNPSTTISFSVTQNSDFVNLEVYNIKGQKVKTLLNEELQKGMHSIIWSGIDENNKLVSSGVYLYKIKAGNQETVSRMLLLK
ncbi:MAG: FlgD immunoglobulin-like domain containing protein [Candidatus Cloacimonadota bacterium]|nr:FlgD immunoglobulin-like domain containing protein [Candidatus Cloacimonadota bacterium]